MQKETAGTEAIIMIVYEAFRLEQKVSLHNIKHFLLSQLPSNVAPAGVQK